MRFLPFVFVIGVLAGCAAREYSTVPEPAGEWVPANPSRSTRATLAAPPAPRAAPDGQEARR